MEVAGAVRMRLTSMIKDKTNMVTKAAVSQVADRCQGTLAPSPIRTGPTRLSSATTVTKMMKMALESKQTLSRGTCRPGLKLERRRSQW